MMRDSLKRLICLVFGLLSPVTPSEVILVKTSYEFQQALKAVSPGDEISLYENIFAGPFFATQSGTKSNPIIISVSGRHTKIVGSPDSHRKESGLTISGKYWILKNIPFENCDTALVLKETDRVHLENLSIQDVNTAIYLQSGEGNTKVQNCAVRNAKIGIHIGVNATTLSNNVIKDISEEPVKIDRGTCCGYFAFNVVEGEFLMGKGYTEYANVYTVKKNKNHGHHHGSNDLESDDTFWSKVKVWFG